MNLLIMQFSLISHHIISLRTKYSPQHPVLKTPQSTFFQTLFSENRGRLTFGFSVINVKMMIMRSNPDN
jgi:hypothetical protein